MWQGITTKAVSVAAGAQLVTFGPFSGGEVISEVLIQLVDAALTAAGDATVEVGWRFGSVEPAVFGVPEEPVTDTAVRIVTGLNVLMVARVPIDRVLPKGARWLAIEINELDGLTAIGSCSVIRGRNDDISSSRSLGGGGGGGGGSSTSS